MHNGCLTRKTLYITDTGTKHPWNLSSLPVFGSLFSEEVKIDHGNRKLIKVILGKMEIRFISRFLFRHGRNLATFNWIPLVVLLVFLFIFIFPLHVKGYLLMVNTQVSKCTEEREREKEIWIENGMLLMSFLFARREALRVVWTPVGEHKSSRRSCEFYQ